MAYLVRQLERKIWLSAELSAEIGGLQADALKNFKTTSNSLSVFILEDKNNEELLHRILSAIASGRNSISEVDYAIFDCAIISIVGIKHFATPGQTADQQVNSLHIDLNNLTASQVIKMAEFISKEGTLSRVSKKAIQKSISKGLSSGMLEKNRLNPTLLEKLQIQRD